MSQKIEPQIQTIFIALLGSFILLFVLMAWLLFPTRSSKITSVPTITPIETSVSTPAPELSTWQTYKNDKYGFEIKLPDSWTNYSMDDFSVKELNGEEDSLYLGSRNSIARPPQIMQITFYLINNYHEAELFSTCTTANLIIGIDKIPAVQKTCQGQETNGFIKIKSAKNIIVIDELKGAAEDHQLFTQILSTLKFIDGDNTAEGKFCGGIAANLPQNQCPDGYTCKLDGSYPDAGGKCTKN